MRDNPVDQAERRESVILLAAALDRLPDEYREAIVLRQTGRTAVRGGGCSNATHDRQCAKTLDAND